MTIMTKILDKTLEVIEKSALKELSGEINLLFVDSDQIKQLNKQYRGKNEKTDVLSFPQYSSEDIEDLDLSVIDYLVLGDIVICDSAITEQSREYNHSELREMCFLFVHGLLHLLGFDHGEITGDEEQTEMYDIQEKILSELGISRD